MNVDSPAVPRCGAGSVWTHPLVAALVIGWLVAVAPIASGLGFNSVYTRDGLDVVAVGDSGSLWRSLNSGYSWTEYSLGAPAALRDIDGRGTMLVVVGDGGSIRRSTNAGGEWTTTTVPGFPAMRAVTMSSSAIWYAAGSGGTILKTTNAGDNWSPLVSGTSSTLNAVCFTSPLHGWAAGNGGTLLETTNGGGTWTPRSLGTSNHLLSVDQAGATVWVTGAGGAAYRSTNGGATFVPIDLKMRGDVNVVQLVGPDTLWIAGGGGFIRYSTDGGASWTFQHHSMHAPITDITSFDTRVWATNSANRIVTFTINTGAVWQFPTGTTLVMSWGTVPAQSAPGTVLGSTFAVNARVNTTFYCAMGSTIFRSGNAGATWTSMASLPPSYTRSNAFVVSAKDTSLWLIACAGNTVPNRVFRSTNAGASWDSVLTMSFGTYGVPLEADPLHPDTVWFGGELSAAGSTQGPIHRSTDFGATWVPVGPNVFRSPCDIAVLPDSTNIIIVADGVTGLGRGRHWRSTDGGQTFVQRDSVIGSEIPGIATTRLRPGFLVSTAWSIGGVRRSLSHGLTWPLVHGAAQAWGIDIAADDPNVVMFGQYAGSFAYISTTGADEFVVIEYPPGFGNNYGFLLADRATMLALQSSGIWKLSFTYGYTPEPPLQSLELSSPNGGEVWPAGTHQLIGWGSANLVLARIEYRRAPTQPWQSVVTTPGYHGGYVWTVPLDLTDAASVRVVDAWDDDPADSSSTPFTIAGPLFAAMPDTLRFPVLAIGDVGSRVITIQNPGAVPLTITSIAVSNPDFWVGRESLVVPPGQSDTVGVSYGPTNDGFDTTAVAVAASDSATVHVVVAVGRGVPNLPVLPGADPPQFVLSQNRPNPFSGGTEIVYALARDADVRLDVYDLGGHRVATLAKGLQHAGNHRVTFRTAGGKAGERAKSLPAGVYFYRLEAGAFSATRKMLVIN